MRVLSKSVSKNEAIPWKKKRETHCREKTHIPEWEVEILIDRQRHWRIYFLPSLDLPLYTYISGLTNRHPFFSSELTFFFGNIVATSLAVELRDCVCRAFVQDPFVAWECEKGEKRHFSRETSVVVFTTLQCLSSRWIRCESGNIIMLCLSFALWELSVGLWKLFFFLCVNIYMCVCAAMVWLIRV